MVKFIHSKIPCGFIKYVGYFLFIVGFFLGFLRFYLGFKPDFLYLNVFAFYSVYVNTKTFEIINNHILDEIIGLFLIIGQYLIIYTILSNNRNNTIIVRSFFYSFSINTLFVIISLLFFYGLAFLYMVLFNLVSFNIFFILFYEFLNSKEKNNS